ncbi:ATP-binding protein [Actinomadura algeriensis]|uniref:histidine kinase n=1 Tax=Actinomadura algeriensis TaxID=1679523 RepID=A0ABR9K3H0_9ACTN|nr:ATP-binding protein [Actinomadura algeriensis]MBE1537362.1 signal transduction histidine kinase [Actinomadura algeriensis]
MMNPTPLPSAPGPASLLPAACAAVLAVAAPLLPGADLGALHKALAVLLAVAALTAAAAAWRLRARCRAALAAAARDAEDRAAELRRRTDELRRRDAADAERERARHVHVAAAVAQRDALAAMADHLLTAQLPAAMRGEPVPPPLTGDPGVAAGGAALARARDAALDAVAGMRADARGRLESQQLATVALARRVQSAMHRVQAEAAVTAERHGDHADVYLACQAVDHLAAQSARLAQGLAIAAGTWEGQQWDTPMRLAEVVQSAAARIEDFQRVRIEGDPDLAIGPVVLEAVIHVLAELLANATESSPTAAPVTVGVTAAAQGAVFRIDDHGAGLEEPRLTLARELLDGAREVTLADMGEVPRLGFAVIARYVRRHGFKVSIGESPYGGLQAVVLVPDAMVADPPVPGRPGALAPPDVPEPPPGASGTTPEASGDAGHDAPGGAADVLPQRVARRGRHRAARPAAPDPAPPPPVAPPPETPEEAGALMDALIPHTSASGAPAPNTPAPDAAAPDPGHPPTDDDRRNDDG